MLGSCDFKVHITKVIFIAEDIWKDRILTGLGIGYHTHCNAGNGTLHRNPCVHQCQRSGTYSRHWWWSVRFKNIRNHADRIRIFVVWWEHLFQCPKREITVTNFSSSRSAVRLYFACWEAREVIVEYELGRSFDHSTVNHLLLQLCSQCYGCEGLGFATCKNRWSMRWRKIVNFTPYLSDFLCLTTV